MKIENKATANDNAYNLQKILTPKTNVSSKRVIINRIIMKIGKNNA